MQTVPGPRQSNSPFPELQLYHTAKGHENQFGGSETVNVRGREFLCKTVREGRMVTMGDRFGFTAGSTTLTPELTKDLDAMADEVKEYSNRLLIRGHASAKDAPEGASAWNLSYRRALAVMEHMTAAGINPHRIRVSACGSVDPIDSDLTPDGRARNRRVEMIVSEELVNIVMPRRVADE
jgi:flagellar motor protein MotB